MELWRRATAWLRQPSAERDPNSDSVIELVRCSTRLEADVTAARIREAGFSVSVFGADAEGWAPHLGMSQGNRVMVRHADAEQIARLLDAAESPPAE